MTPLLQGTVPFPDDGDPTAPDRLATELHTAAGALTRAAAPLVDVVGATRAVWRGTAAEGFEADVGRQGRHAEAVVDTAARAVPVLQTYAAAVTATRSRYQDAVVRERQAAAAGAYGTSARALAVAEERACVAAHTQATATCVRALDVLRAGLAAPAGRPGAPAPAPPAAEPVPTVTNTAALTDEDYRQAATRLGVDQAAVRAVAEVETTSSPFLPDGRPKILYEPHYFRRLTGGRYDRTHPHLSAPYDRNRRYGTHTRQHDLLDEAARLDRSAALQSASWGRFQVMGANYRSAGYASVEELAADARAGEAGQLRMFVNHIEADATLHQALRDRDWRTFARIYNGTDGVRRGYHTRMADAYTRYAGGE